MIREILLDFVNSEQSFRDVRKAAARLKNLGRHGDKLALWLGEMFKTESMDRGFLRGVIDTHTQREQQSC